MMQQQQQQPRSVAGLPPLPPSTTAAAAVGAVPAPAPARAPCLPLAAWQVIAAYLSPEDALSARLSCSTWRRDLGAFVAVASALPSQLCAADAPDSAHLLPGDAAAVKAGAASDGGGSGVAALLAAYPHAQRVVVDVSTCEEQALAPHVLDALAAATAAGGSQQGRSAGQLQLCLTALPRSFQCPARQEVPAVAPGAAASLFAFLLALPRQLGPSALASLSRVVLESFPEQPCAWACLSGLPALRQLLLPAIKPALPHEHLPHLAAAATQLTLLQLSVQGSVTAWRDTGEAVGSLSRLVSLASLSLHAFSCPGRELTAALAHLAALRELRLSGRIVLAPLETLTRLTALRALELTQDVELEALCDLHGSLPRLTQLAVGRVTLGAAAAGGGGGGGGLINAGAAAAAGAGGAGADQQLWPPLPAAIAAGGGPAPALAAGAAAAAAGPAAAVNNNANNNNAGGAGGGGEVVLEDVGAIVDGLVANLAEGGVPLHLVQIIQRFETLIQLDLTRRPVGGSRSSCSPWAVWPAGAGAAGGGAAAALLLQPDGAAPLQQQQEGEGLEGALDSLELGLLAPRDVERLTSLPDAMRGVRHLSLRLRDQLLAFASVRAATLAPGQLAPLGCAFPHLTALSLSGKVALNGHLLQELLAALRGGGGGAGGGMMASSSSSSGARPAPAGGPGGRLRSLSLDVHFVGVAPAHVAGALATTPRLQVLALRHRGVGKLLLPLSALPRTLTELALRKVMLVDDSPAAAAAAAKQARRPPAAVAAAASSTEQLLCGPTQHASDAGGSSSSRSSPVVSPLPLAALGQQADGGADAPPPDDQQQQQGQHPSSHAVTSPGFCRAVVTNSISSADLTGLTANGALAGGADGAAAAVGGGAAGGSSAAADASLAPEPLLPHLRRLLLRLCFVPARCVSALLGVPITPAHAGSVSSTHGGGPVAVHCNRVLQVLSVAGEGRSEVCGAWRCWLAALAATRGLQVLDLALPEADGSSSSRMLAELLDLLSTLPRLQRLHLATSHAAADDLARLAALTGLRALVLQYSGPPVLPEGMLQQLRAGLGPLCRVELWEQVAPQEAGSFGPAVGPSDGVDAAAAPDHHDGAASGGGDAAGSARARGRLARWWRRRPRALRVLLPAASGVLAGCVVRRVTQSSRGR